METQNTSSTAHPRLWKTIAIAICVLTVIFVAASILHRVSDDRTKRQKIQALIDAGAYYNLEIIDKGYDPTLFGKSYYVVLKTVGGYSEKIPLTKEESKKYMAGDTVQCVEFDSSYVLVGRHPRGWMRDAMG